MAQAHKAKPPLDVLQSMVNGILIEVGRALRATEGESGRTLASASLRLKTTIPSAVDHFQQALDELEIDILRAKAVVLRDLNEKRAERIARENPVTTPEPQVIEEVPVAIAPVEQPMEVEVITSSPPEEQIKGPEINQPAHAHSPSQPIEEIPITSDLVNTPAVQTIEPQQEPILADTTSQTTSKPQGLGIDTEAITSQPSPTAAPDTAVTAPQSVDSLFGEDNVTESDLELFGAMDFSQTQTLDFGNSNTATTSNNNTQIPEVDANKQLNDMFDMDTTAEVGAGGISLDMEMAEESAFDDLLWGEVNDTGGDFDDLIFD